MLNRIMLNINNRIKEIKEVILVPGSGYLSFKTYPNTVKIRTITAIEKVKITEDAFSILVDL